MLSCLFVPPYLSLVREDAYQRMISEKKKRKKEVQKSILKHQLVTMQSICNFSYFQHTHYPPSTVPRKDKPIRKEVFSCLRIHNINKAPE